MSKSIYTFISPVSYDETIEMFKYAVGNIKGAKIKEKSRGFLLMRFSPSYYIFPKYELYVETSGNTCMVRATGKGGKDSNANIHWVANYHKPKEGDIAWMRFVNSLCECYPDLDFRLKPNNISLSDVMFIDNGMERIYSAYSLASFGLLGGAITVGNSRKAFAGKLLTRVRLSNGRIIEGYVKRNSKAHNMMLVNLNELTQNSKDYNC